jgi:transposase
LGGKKTGKNPTDRGKLGAKRSVLTEAKGVPVGLAIEGANRHDMKLVKATIQSIPVERPKPTEEAPQGMCLDKGYDFEEVRDILVEFGFTAHIRARGEEAQAIKREAGYRARRWVVERTHSWMNRFRRILVRWEKKAGNYLALLHFACAWIAFKACGLLG